MTPTLLKLIIIFTCFLLGCILSTFGARQKRISGGDMVSSKEHSRHIPFVVYVKACGSKGCQHCMGTVVKDKVVLTAASCFCHLHGKIWIKVYMFDKSAYRTGSLKQSYPVAYNCNEPHKIQVNLARIGLFKQFPNLEPARLVCKTLSGKQEVMMVGFGQGQNFHAALVTAVSCPSEWRNKNPICTGADAGMQQTTEGDHGSPLFNYRNKTYQLIGVSHGLMALPGSKTFDVWTSVSSHCQWIKHGV